jgi:hypothetical protein
VNKAAPGLALFAPAPGRLLPPRLFNTPTAEILPSLNVHMGSGWTFGFSGEESSNRWVMSIGLGGVSEVLLATQRIDHITVPKSNPLAGLRLKLPVRWMGETAADHLMLAANVAATRDQSFSAPAGFQAEGGTVLRSLEYDYRETTVGVVGTWSWERLRLHGALHASDLRTENARYDRGDGVVEVADSKSIRPAFGLGLDYRVNPKTYFLAEVRTAPKLVFSADRAHFDLEGVPEYAAGIRYFFARPVALDALVAANGEAEGPADLEMGLGLNILFGLPAGRADRPGAGAPGS